MRKHGYNEEIHGGLRLESVTPVVLVHANHALTQGSLHYRLATLGYKMHHACLVDSNYLHAKMIYKIQLIGNKQVTLFVKLNR